MADGSNSPETMEPGKVIQLPKEPGGLPKRVLTDADFDHAKKSLKPRAINWKAGWMNVLGALGLSAGLHAVRPPEPAQPIPVVDTKGQGQPGSANFKSAGSELIISPADAQKYGIGVDHELLLDGGAAMQRFEKFQKDPKSFMNDHPDWVVVNRQTGNTYLNIRNTPGAHDDGASSNFDHQLPPHTPIPGVGIKIGTDADGEWVMTQDSNGKIIYYSLYNTEPIPSNPKS